MTDAARAAVAAIAAQWAVPGGAVIAVDREGEIFSHHFGYADTAAGHPVEPYHLFEIGSISKVFTAIAILRLARHGLIKLDQPVSAVLDWLPSALRGEQITVGRLLNHTAGLVSGVDALPDELGQVATFRGAVSPAAPGTFFHYSNLGFIMLGLAAAQVSGRPLVELVRDDILAPLGMTQSIPAVTHDDYPALARGYQARHDDRPWAPGAALAPAPWLEVAGADGNIATTAADLGRFARMLLGRGRIADTTVLTAAEFDTMITHLAPDGEDVLPVPGCAAADSSRYGLGINIESHQGRTVLSHGGGMVGYASFLLADLDAGIAVGVLTNSNGDSPVAEAIARSVTAELITPGTVDVDGFDPNWWDAGIVDRNGWAGTFTATDAICGCSAAVSAGQQPQVAEVSVAERRDGRVRLMLRHGAAEAPLLRGWNGAGVAQIPGADRFTWQFQDGTWVWGPRVFIRAGLAAADGICGCSPAVGAGEQPQIAGFCGHYRCYSPWFTNFRVALRGGTLFLVAAGGVEAPATDTALIPLGESVFRIGADPRLPERLTFGPQIGGRAAWADRDGCRYSRAFTD